MEVTFERDGRQYSFETCSDTDFLVYRLRKYSRFYEQDLLYYSKRLIEALEFDSGLIVDCGANIGNHSVFWGTHTPLQILAIEANPPVAGCLQRNMKRNLKPGTFQAISGGVGETSGWGDVKFPESSEDQPVLARVEPVAGPSATTIEIQPVPVWIERANLSHLPVRILKIDIEGLEMEVLRGAKSILERDKPELFLEAGTPAHQQRLDELLTPLGYNRLKRFCTTPTWHFTTLTDASLRQRLWLAGIHERLRWRFHKMQNSLQSRMSRKAA